ncbi:hypothetical protein [Fulvivirga sedimenti]|uniref:DUF4397 domain-containing protein n=1 Tax=Fulvivirga sedimenti TaxID=2879465 RepID=A0A9X1HN56_9BACT|nr:hypothetical protein [Fulvivirga sedimenti]MCA6074065.1 hypothetical protein [Fulvivirga sedimenti]
MKRMKYLLNFSLLLAVLLALTSCNDDDAPGEPGIVRLRVSNHSPVKFDQVYVNTGGGEHDYGVLAPGSTSDYITFQYVYRYAYVKVVAGDKTYVIQPIDYVGETKYFVGSYTYILDIIEPESMYGLSLEFRKN